MARALLTAGAHPGWADRKGRTAAQNMAAKGPLGALAELLEARPQDVGGDGAVAKKAFGALAARGAEGLARAEEAAVATALDVGDKAPSVVKKRRSAL